jgi:hypothetical protein
MTSRILTLAAIALAFPLSVLAVESGHQEHGAHAPQKIELNAGKKWATDDALRQGMSSIRKSIAGSLPAAEYDALGKELGAQVAYIVQNCKLDPKADAQLHIVVGDIVNGIDTLEGKDQNKKRALGVVKVAQALNTYGKHFDHAGWQSITLPH